MFCQCTFLMELSCVLKTSLCCHTHTHRHSRVQVQEDLVFVASRCDVSFGVSGAWISQEHSNRLDNTAKDYTNTHALAWVNPRALFKNPGSTARFRLVSLTPRESRERSVLSYLRDLVLPAPSLSLIFNHVYMGSDSTLTLLLLVMQLIRTHA